MRLSTITIICIAFLVSIALLGLTGCQTAQVQSPVSPEKQADLRKTVTDLAVNSSCAKYNFVQQGKPKPGYMKGVALTYARAICNSGAEIVKIAGQPLGDAAKDALTFYGKSPKNYDERLAMTYSLLVGSAARESSWRWCCGRDVNAKESDKQICLYGNGSTCEAGLHQTSYNAIGSNKVLRDLYEQYKADKAGCFEAEYINGTTCDAANLKNWGSGESKTFQELSKHCPGFSVEMHAAMVRVQRKHYHPLIQGPDSNPEALKRGAAELRSECTDMFLKVGEIVKANPEICSAL